MHPHRRSKSEIRVCVRKRIPEGLEELGVTLDKEKNEAAIGAKESVLKTGYRGSAPRFMCG